jgi:hypothetical protein
MNPQVVEAIVSHVFNHPKFEEPGNADLNGSVSALRLVRVAFL